MKQTIKYFHRLREDYTFEYYGPITFKAGRLLAKTDTPEKLNTYEEVLGHGASEYINPDLVQISRVTTTIIEETMVD